MCLAEFLLGAANVLLCPADFQMCTANFFLCMLELFAETCYVLLSVADSAV